MFGVKREGTGDSGTGGGGGSAPQPTGTPQEPSQAPAGGTSQAAAQQPTQAVSAAPEGFVPVDSLRAVTAERDRLKREADDRETESQKKQGEWQAVAEKNDAKAKDFEARFLTTARRAAFVAEAAKAGKVSDPMAAYKLALTDGLLNDIPVTDDGEAEQRAIAKAVEKITESYGFLKSGAGSFGGERSGQQPETTGFDPAKADSRTMLQEGYLRARSGS
jgi:hypothetical protein